MVKKLHKSKAMWLAFGVELIGILELVQASLGELRVTIPPEYYGYVLIGIGIAIRVVRVYTTQALGDKQ